MEIMFVSRKETKFSIGETIEKITYKAPKYWIDITVIMGSTEVKFTSSAGVYSPGIEYDPISHEYSLRLDGFVRIQDAEIFKDNVKDAIETALYVSEHLSDLINQARRAG